MTQYMVFQLQDKTHGFNLRRDWLYTTEHYEIAKRVSLRAILYGYWESRIYEISGNDRPTLRLTFRSKDKHIVMFISRTSPGLEMTWDNALVYSEAHWHDLSTLAKSNLPDIIECKYCGGAGVVGNPEDPDECPVCKGSEWQRLE